MSITRVVYCYFGWLKVVLKDRILYKRIGHNVGESNVMLEEDNSTYQKVRQYAKRLEDMPKDLTMHQKIQQQVERTIDVSNPWSSH